ncbi:hypothetical protein F5Y18DRAFT_248544 [Xylariaceae sp. FL1019]|nr:hypothetical protein F5Y18DRAFT_248544 [Xylariaceae sp. FL1019]
MAISESKKSLLLEMPAELRNIIYDLVVRSEWGNTTSTDSHFVLDRPLPALFRVNKQLRTEALDNFLLKNRFHVYTSKVGFKWLEILGEEVERFRFLSVFIDLNIDSWRRYINALLPKASPYLRLSIRKAAVSLQDARLNRMLEALGLDNTNVWTSERISPNEVLYKRVKSLPEAPVTTSSGAA